jgi:hypothetical protein
VLAADIMSIKMRMFSFCSVPIKESSNLKDGNIILNIRNQQNIHGNQLNSGQPIFSKHSRALLPLCELRGQVGIVTVSLRFFC